MVLDKDAYYPLSCSRFVLEMKIEAMEDVKVGKEVRGELLKDVKFANERKETA